MHRCAAAAVVTVGALAACASHDATSTCPPSAVTGELRVKRSDVVDGGSAEHDYALSASEVEALVVNGSLTVTAGQDDAGAGPLGAGDPVVALTMRPVPDAPGSYELHGANAVFCPSTSAKLVFANGSVTGCSPSGSVLTVPLNASVVVASPSNKSIGTVCHPGGCWSGVYISGEYGASCP